MTPGQSPTRGLFLRFLLAVATVHVIAIALYYALDVAQASEARQREFAWAWMAVTVVVVFAGLQLLRRARRGR